MTPRWKRLVSVFLVLSILSLAASPAVEAKSFFTLRRSFGLVFLGGSALFGKQAWDYRSEADDFYERYKTAETSREADQLYRKTTNRDVKSQISLALSVAFAVSSLRLLFSKEAEEPKMLDLPEKDGLSLEVKGDLKSRKISVGVTRELWR